jgi:hypothetical protein
MRVRSAVRTVPIPEAISRRIKKLPKWARDYIHNVQTFVGAEEVEELTFLRDQNCQLIQLIRELKAENARLKKKVKLKPR